MMPSLVCLIVGWSALSLGCGVAAYILAPKDMVRMTGRIVAQPPRPRLGISRKP